MLGKLKKIDITSIIATSLIISLLVLSGPVLAVVVGVSPDKSLYKAGDSVVFTVYVDIEASERVPVQNLTLRIKNSTGTAIESCVFWPNGTAISGCTNITSITPTSTTPYGWGYGYMWGYGYSTSGYSNQSFGYGYGYSYNSSYSYGGVWGAELQYNVTWNVTKANPSDGNYTADLEALAQKGGTSHTYSSSSSTRASFVLDRTAPILTIHSPISVTYSTTSLSLTYSATDAISLNTTWYEYNGVNSTLTGNTSFTALDDQTSTLTLWANDTAGNLNSTSVTFTVSTPTPTIGGGIAAAPGPAALPPAEVEEAACVENWVCTEWGECIDGVQNRVCIDNNNCGTTVYKPEETQTCVPPAPPCVENWACTEWSDCVNGTQTRDCVDLSRCGTAEDKPEDFKTCISAPTIPLGFTAILIGILALVAVAVIFLRFIH